MSIRGDWWAGEPLLCVGGPKDGQLMTILHGRVARLPATRPIAGRHGPMTSDQFDFHEYHLKEIAFTDGRIGAAWVLSSMSEREALQRLEEHLGSNPKDAAIADRESVSGEVSGERS